MISPGASKEADNTLDLNSKKLRELLSYLIPLAIVGSMNLRGTYQLRFYVPGPAGITSSLILAGVCLKWCFSVRRRFPQKQMRNNMTLFSAAFILLSLLSHIKYSFAPPGGTAARYLWYAYYNPADLRTAVYGPRFALFRQTGRLPDLKKMVYYFRYMPVEWIVIDTDTGLVVSKDIVDSQAYQNMVCLRSSEYYQAADSDVFANDYAQSSIRAWLNEDFYDTAFTDEEKAAIGVTHLNNDADASHPQLNSAPTDDKLFLLSIDEAQNEAYGFASNDDRTVSGTDYAKAQGLTVEIEDHSYWFLRSPSTSSYRAAVVFYSGGVTSMTVSGTFVGIRPAFRFINGMPDPDFGDGLQVGEYYLDFYSMLSYQVDLGDADRWLDAFNAGSC